ncbi:amino acid adenylation domain-containing protein, partial [Vineibacter terrae]|uniref:non-ribosomal peptide synthetase n=1 Tax=Vineibacter terrae TaxID=2586908 RepID=UPI002E30930F
TSFQERDGRIFGIVHPDLHLPLPLVDLTHLPPAERDAAALALATDDARKPFDLERAPLLRAQVVRLAEDEHRLHLTLHHIIFDGVSIYRVMMPQLAALYAGFARGEPPDLPEPRLQYGDYALWRERQLADAASARALDYWREKLAGDLPVLALPADRPPPARPSHRGAMQTFSLSRALTARLKALGAQHGVTFYTTLLAGFKAMLHRYTGQQDIVIGGVTDMRRRPELDQVIGYFLNSLALRTHPSPETPFRDYLAQVQATVVEALDACGAPFDQVVRAVRPRRDGSRHPLFQVLFSIEPPAAPLAEGWALTQMDVTVGIAKFDLYLELDEDADRIIGRFLYSTDLFDAATIARMIGHWQTLLQGVADDPSRPLFALPLLTEQERRALLVDANATDQAAPQVTLHAWFEAQARTTPDAIAVQGDGVSWSYGELARRAAAMAQHLRHAGAGPQTLVAIAMQRSPAMVAALLAILAAGGAYLPLDPDLPAARLALLLADAVPAILLTEPAVAERLPESAARVIVYRDDIALPAPTPADPAQPADLAYVLYTSGSTGKPKAVEIEHRSVVNLLAAVQRDIGFGAGDSLLAVTTLSFDIAALELFLPLVSGGRLVIASRDDAADPSRLLALLASCCCTTMQATPATWRGLIGAGWSGDKQLRILCGGEALPRDLAEALLSRAACVWNMYGPTETTIWSLCHKVSPSEDPVPIGRPLANTRVYVADENGMPVPAGIPGELLIAGAGLARGYRNDPALTAARFVTLPGVPAERLYRTGDVVKQRADGVVDFLGRRDNQVKIRGFRVGLEEIESALAAHPLVTAAAVRAAPDASGALSLTAFVAAAQPDTAMAPRLRDFLRAILPGYMVPTRIAVLAALPMTANGKVDRKALPMAPPADRPAVLAQPRDALESRLAAIWQDLLGTAPIGIHDDFFELGGHSLLAALLMSRIKAAEGRDLPLATLFNAPTIAGLADVLRSGAAPGFSHLVLLRPGVGRPLFIVHGIFGNVMQLRALALRIRSGRPVYALQARGADPRQAPHASIAEMVDAYLDALRSVQASGPYAVAGYSFGGLVAFEMARRLREHGETVELLALLETDLHERYLPPLAALRYQWTLASRVIAKVTTLPMPQVPAYLAAKLRQAADKMLVRLGLRAHAVALDGPGGALSARERLMYRIGARAFLKFRPRRYDGKISVFRVTGPRFDACDPLPIWRRVADSVEVHDIDGAHDTVMHEPHVRSLADQLSRCLCRPDGSAQPSTMPSEPVPASDGALGAPLASR